MNLVKTIKKEGFIFQGKIYVKGKINFIINILL